MEKKIDNQINKGKKKEIHSSEKMVLVTVDSS